MARNPATMRSDRRRNVLRLVGAAGGLGFLAGRSGAQDDGDERRFHVQQANGCVPATPLSGDQPVEDFYEYTYPRGQFDGLSGVTGTSYSSQGTVDLQRENTSILFLYDGPDGLSLVFVHGRVDETEEERPAAETTTGGTVSFEVRGLPEAGQWAVLDDYYTVDGEQSESNYDRYVRGERGDILHWAYRGGRTDGGAFRGLGDEPEVRVHPAFNEDAGLSEDYDFGTVEKWEVLSGNLEDPERKALALDEPIRVAAGTCPEEAETSEWSDDAEDRTEV